MTKETEEAINILVNHTEPVRHHLHLILVLAGQHAKGFEKFPGYVLLDPTMHFHYSYGSQNGALYCIRPDGYIGFSSHPTHPAELQKYLTRSFKKLR